MLYKVLNKLFGWDYVHWRNSADSGVARVYHGIGVDFPYYWRYRNDKVLDLITRPERVTWLTCDPSKYGLGVEDE